MQTQAAESADTTFIPSSFVGPASISGNSRHNQSAPYPYINYPYITVFNTSLFFSDLIFLTSFFLSILFVISSPLYLSFSFSFFFHKKKKHLLLFISLFSSHHSSSFINKNKIKIILVAVPIRDILFFCYSGLRLAIEPLGISSPIARSLTP
jgi:hypothetical protein